MRGRAYYGNKYQLLCSSLILLFSIMPTYAEQLPLHSLIWLTDSEEVADPEPEEQVGLAGYDRSIHPNDYCRPEFRSLLISLANTASENIDVPANLIVFSGWLDLIQIIDQERCSTLNVAKEVTGWQARYSKHPAISLFPELFGSDRRGLRVAVLLPLQGEMEALSQMIYAGIEPVAETYGLDIQVIDSTELFQDSAFEKNTKVIGDVDCIIGPLEKQRVAQFASTQPTVPVLALNFLPVDSPLRPQLYQMALRPEDEAYALADLIAGEGHTRGVLLYAEGHAGNERMADALLNRWEAYGGALEAYELDPEQTDFSVQLKKLLQISESETRHKEMERLLGYSVKFEPRRRQDIEFVAMLIDQLHGRMLKPQLKFWYAGGLPVYSTSKLLGTNPFTANNDLDGVHLTLPSWMAFENAQMAANSENTLEWSLKFLGESAARIVQASQCLSSNALLLEHSLGPAWIFDTTTQRFHYRSQHAVIDKDQLNY